MPDLRPTAPWLRSASQTQLNTIKDYEPTDLEYVRTDATWKAISLTFSQSEFNSENVEFLDALDDRQSAQTIYDTFISTSAPKQVNLPASMREPLTTYFTTPEADRQGDANFAEARAEVFRMLKADTFVRFKAQVTAERTALEAQAPVDWDKIQTRP